MHHALTDCGCVDDICSTMPPEFVRVRYFYGQRLGVMELSDEAAYHQGKHAFPNARLHGAGVLCGLRAERFVTVVGSDTTVLRVIRGAAIDACGREIVVGVDQCIDVAAWFARNRNKLAAFASGDALHVCLRYRECPSDPSPAPRDPGGCGTGSCEYGRVREGFELSLLTDAEKDACQDTSFPPSASLLAALNGPVGSAGATAGALEQQIAGLVSADCPEPVADVCLCLASFTVELDASTPPVPIDITEPDNAIPERRSLLSTTALQSIALALAMEGLDAGLLGAGPRAGRLEFTASPPDGGVLQLLVVLATTATTPPTGIPLVEGTFDPTIVRVHRLDSTGWTDVTPPVADIDLDQGPPQFTITFANGLKKDLPYLLRFAIDPGAPIADDLGRPLRPQPITRLFKFVDDGAGALKLDQPL
jgi:hypothetical protein